MKKMILSLAGALLGMAVPLASHAADLEAGKAAFIKYTCASCHGEDAKSSTSPEYPILAGQHRDYLVHALNAYKRGQAGAPTTSNVRKNAIMGAMVTQLSPDDIENMAAWLASLSSPLAVRK